MPRLRSHSRLHVRSHSSLRLGAAPDVGEGVVEPVDVPEGETAVGERVQSEWR